MQERYLVDGPAQLIWEDLEDSARSLGCYLWGLVDSEDSFPYLTEQRFDIVRALDTRRIGQLAVTHETRGTRLLLTDERHREAQGGDLETAEFARFKTELLARLGAEGWRIVAIS